MGLNDMGLLSKKILENFNLMNLDLLTVDQLRNKVEKTWIEHIKLCQDNFMYFVKEVWPEFIYRKATKSSEWGHHQLIANEFTRISEQKKGRLIVNMPPRHTKSEFASSSFSSLVDRTKS